MYERVPHVTLKSIAQNPDIEDGMSREEIDAAIARHADTEILYDRPYSDKKVVRVAGPFTVESLSPHRVVADDPADHAAPVPAPIEESGRYVEMILDNLRTSWRRQPREGRATPFRVAPPFAGKWIQAEGTYLEGDREKRVAVAIGPSSGPWVGTSCAKRPSRPAATSTCSSCVASPSMLEPMPNEPRPRRSVA